MSEEVPKQRAPVYAGLDMGTSTLTLVVIDAEGKVLWDETYSRPLPKDSSEWVKAQRLWEISTQVLNKLKLYSKTHDLRVWNMEGYAHGAKFHAHQMGEIGGVMRYRSFALVQRGSLVFPNIVQPTTLKKFVTGKGSGKGTDKRAIAVQVFRQWDVEFDNEHKCDAYALAQMARAADGKYSVPLTKHQADALKKVRS